MGALAAFGGCVQSRCERTRLPRRSAHRTPLASTAVGDSALGFTAIAANQDDVVTVPDGYVAQVLIPWGDPIAPGGPAFKFDGTQHRRRAGAAVRAWATTA